MNSLTASHRTDESSNIATDNLDIVNTAVIYTQLFRESLFYKTAKAYTTVPDGLTGNHSLPWLEVLVALTRWREMQIYSVFCNMTENQRNRLSTFI